MNNAIGCLLNQEEILKLSEDYVRTLSKETQHTIDGPFAGRHTGYGKDKSELIVFESGLLVFETDLMIFEFDLIVYERK